MSIDLNNWAPRRIMIIPQDKQGKIITAEYWSSLWQASIEQGDYAQDTLEELINKLHETAWHPTDAAETISNPEIYPDGSLHVAGQLTELKEFADQIIADLLQTAWHPTDAAETISNPAIYSSGAEEVSGQIDELKSHMDAAESNIQTNTNNIADIFSGTKAAYTADRLDGQLPAFYAKASQISGMQNQIDELAVGAISAFSHNDISNRNAADAHSVAAITVLDSTLNTLEYDLGVLTNVVGGMTHAGFLDKNDPDSHVVAAIQYAEGVTLAQKLANIDSTIANITGDVSAITHNNILGRDEDHAHPVSAISGLIDILAAKQNNLTGGASTIASSNLTANRALLSSAAGKVAVSPVTNTELGYLAGVTSALQTQLNGKQATIAGAASTVAAANLTASRALRSNSSGKIVVSPVTDAELGRLAGVTSAIQTQLNSKQPKITYGTGNPSGGSNGDVYIKYA